MVLLLNSSWDHAPSLWEWPVPPLHIEETHPKTVRASLARRLVRFVYRFLDPVILHPPSRQVHRQERSVSVSSHEIHYSPLLDAMTVGIMTSQVSRTSNGFNQASTAGSTARHTSTVNVVNFKFHLINYFPHARNFTINDGHFGPVESVDCTTNDHHRQTSNDGTLANRGQDAGSSSTIINNHGFHSGFGGGHNKQRSELGIIILLRQHSHNKPII